MSRPAVGIILGSATDLKVVQKAADQLLEEFGIDSEITVASAHRTPKKVLSYAMNAHKKFDLIIAAAGMAAHLPGVIASHTILPVIGLPVSSPGLAGFDALYAVVQMPPGVPVACVAIDGAKNAAILAAEILAGKYPKIRKRLMASRARMNRTGKA